MDTTGRMCHHLHSTSCICHSVVCFKFLSDGCFTCLLFFCLFCRRRCLIAYDNKQYRFQSEGSFQNLTKQFCYRSVLFPSTLCLKKNIPDVFSYNSRNHCRIFIIFGRNIGKKASNPPHLINASALPCKTEHTENVYFHVYVSC